MCNPPTDLSPPTPRGARPNLKFFEWSFRQCSSCVGVKDTDCLALVVWKVQDNVFLTSEDSELIQWSLINFCFLCLWHKKISGQMCQTRKKCRKWPCPLQCEFSCYSAAKSRKIGNSLALGKGDFDQKWNVMPSRLQCETFVQDFQNPSRLLTNENPETTQQECHLLGDPWHECRLHTPQWQGSGQPMTLCNWPTLVLFDFGGTYIISARAGSLSIVEVFTRILRRVGNDSGHIKNNVTFCGKIQESKTMFSTQSFGQKSKESSYFEKTFLFLNWHERTR